MLQEIISDMIYEAYIVWRKLDVISFYHGAWIHLILVMFKTSVTSVLELDLPDKYQLSNGHSKDIVTEDKIVSPWI